MLVHVNIPEQYSIDIHYGGQRETGKHGILSSDSQKLVNHTGVQLGRQQRSTTAKHPPRHSNCLEEFPVRHLSLNSERAE